MADNTKYISDWTLERYLLGELPAHMLREIALTIQSSSNLQERVSTIRQNNEDFQEEYPTQQTVSSIMDRYKQSKKKRVSLWFTPLLQGRFLVPALAAFLFMIFIFPEFTSHKENEAHHIPFGHDTTRIKGENAYLTIYRRINNKKAELLSSGSIVRENDLLQISYTAHKNNYGAILSIDGNGNVTLHHPSKRFLSTKIKTKKETLLKRSYQLDDAPKFEKFFFLTSLKPFKIQAILEKAQKFARNINNVRKQRLPVSKKYQQASILLIKASN